MMDETGKVSGTIAKFSSIVTPPRCRRFTCTLTTPQLSHALLRDFWLCGRYTEVISLRRIVGRP
jgi:hypothetical protein